LISQTAEYALRAVVSLAARPETSQTTAEIAEVTCVPLGYLSKVMQSLVRGGLVSSQRGLGGGFLLRKAPSEITVLEVVNAVDPIRRIESCPLGLPEHEDRLCPLHQRLDTAMAQIEATLRDSVIGEMLRGPRERRPLCAVKAALTSTGMPGRPPRGRRPLHK
jgi:Rrf2 family nitric oxide-sensitive transcriptional repressor